MPELHPDWEIFPDICPEYRKSALFPYNYFISGSTFIVFTTAKGKIKYLESITINKKTKTFQYKTLVNQMVVVVITTN